jgi:hypothetical protein
MNDITDVSLRAAIMACRPFEYLDDLKKRVAEQIGQPGLENEHDFGYRVYCLNQQIERETTDARIASMGFRQATPELLTKLEGRKVDMLFGVGGIFGERVETGSIKANGRGGYFFLPKGKRTKGFVPTYIREAGRAGVADEVGNGFIVAHRG